MGRRLAVWVVAGALCAGPAAAGPWGRSAVGAEVLGGGQACLAHGNASCEGIDVGPMGGVSAEYRIGDYFGAALTFQYGRFKVPNDAFLRLMGFTIGPRAFVPIGPWELFLEGGLGWSETRGGQAGYGQSVDGYALGFALGGRVWLNRYLAVGAALRYHVPFPERYCEYYRGSRSCRDVRAGSDQAHTVMFGVSLATQIPL